MKVTITNEDWGALSPLSLTLIGRSPFLNSVDLKRIKYKKAYINQNLPDADYVISFDNLFKPNEVKCPYIAPCNEYKIQKNEPNFDKNKKNLLGYCHFSASIGINYAYLNGFENVFLVGIDHNESEDRFLRFDNTTSNPIERDLHKRFKEFVYKFKGKMNIYQTNPDTNWDLDYIDIRELYKGGQNEGKSYSKSVV